MAIAKAQTVAEEAFNELTVRLRAGQLELDGFTKLRLERAAKSAITIAPAAAHQVLAILAGLQWDDAAMDEHFGIAMRYDTGSRVEHNYATVLLALDRYIEAANMFERASNTNPNDLGLLRSASAINWQAGRWQRALELAELLKQRSPDQEVEPLASQHSMVELAQRNDVSLLVIEQLHTALYSFLHDRRIRVQGSSAGCDLTPGEESLYVTIRINGDSAAVQRLDEELTPVLFDAVEAFPVGSFHIGLGVSGGDARDAR
jgi:tetratricopeptide (TPR) repeat protein